MINLTFLSQLLSFTIPVRAGEIAKGVYLSTEYNLHFGKAIIWVFLDRFLDFWAVLGLSLILLLVIPTNLPQGLYSVKLNCNNWPSGIYNVNIAAKGKIANRKLIISK